MSDGPVSDAADWWMRLYSRRSQTNLYPLLLEYPDDSVEPVGGDYEVAADAASYFRSEWTDDAWPPFKEWPGLATPAATVTDADACAAALATAVARDGRARCLALVQVARGADAPAALSWLGMTNHMTAQELSAVLRSWEDRFGVRVVGLGHGSLYVSVAAPPTDVHQARVLAAEHYLTCPDIFYEYPEVDWSTYHEELMKDREWRFWWD
ncbi:DUF4253 domain-containing protein [Streptomyces sp. Ncost-T10-10d]|uniref:DUF4253 domain-containing protein n=1 Tax=Streptomyces sp. Ncost-T10-10d TaxID=1839774 RepID=UPI00081EB631|nr:DUF4253 domain-containing protein [Streptomyces sp. Ncost-T10-10d]SCF95731.1 protein of unknown function [Streptomyces sp. Ncost-T10-10d]